MKAAANLCRLLRGEVAETLAREHTGEETRPVFTGLAKDWRALLFPGLTDEEFADAYAQTVTFALLLARVDGIAFNGGPLSEIARQLGKKHSLMGKALGVLTEQTTVAQIAEAARVAANTVYTSVGGKPQLLAAITEGGTGDPDVAETLTAVARTTDPAEVIRLTAAGTRRVNERRAKAVAVLLDSAQADPAAAEMLRVTVGHYRDALATLARRLEDLGAVQPPDLNLAADIFWYLFGWTSWRILITDLQWSWDEAEQWLAQRGIDALLKPARPGP